VRSSIKRTAAIVASIPGLENEAHAEPEMAEQFDKAFDTGVPEPEVPGVVVGGCSDPERRLLYRETR